MVEKDISNKWYSGVTEKIDGILPFGRKRSCLNTTNQIIIMTEFFQFPISKIIPSSFITPFFKQIFPTPPTQPFLGKNLHKGWRVQAMNNLIENTEFQKFTYFVINNNLNCYSFSNWAYQFSIYQVSRIQQAYNSFCCFYYEQNGNYISSELDIINLSFFLFYKHTTK